MHEKFEQLSVVTEETSAENSENSINKESSPVEQWNDFESNIIQPDQSYPIYSNIDKTKTLPSDDKMHFLSPIDPMNNFEANTCNQLPNEMVYPDYYNTVPFNNTSKEVADIKLEDKLGMYHML